MAGWKLRLVTQEQLDALPNPTPVGTCWYWPSYPREFLSPSYLAERAKVRPPLMIQFPGSCSFCVDSKHFRDGVPFGEGWRVSGTPENLTVAPSIDLGHSYHGFIENGVISPDVRPGWHDAAGNLIK